MINGHIDISIDIRLSRGTAAMEFIVARELRLLHGHFRAEVSAPAPVCFTLLSSIYLIYQYSKKNERSDPNLVMLDLLNRYVHCSLLDQ